MQKRQCHDRSIANVASGHEIADTNGDTHHIDLLNGTTTSLIERIGTDLEPFAVGVDTDGRDRVALR